MTGPSPKPFLDPAYCWCHMEQRADRIGRPGHSRNMSFSARAENLEAPLPCPIRRLLFELCLEQGGCEISQVWLGWECCGRETCTLFSRMAQHLGMCTKVSRNLKSVSLRGGRLAGSPLYFLERCASSCLPPAIPLLQTSSDIFLRQDANAMSQKNHALPWQLRPLSFRCRRHCATSISHKVPRSSGVVELRFHCCAMLRNVRVVRSTTRG